MRKIVVILAVLMTFCFYKVQAQVFIDSIKVFEGTYPIIDSVYLGFVHRGQTLQSISTTPFNDACGTTYVYATFSGCDTTGPSKTDTMLVLGYGTKQGYLRGKWDTLSTCALPTTPVYTDSMLWSCYPTGINDQQPNGKIILSPNPAHDVVHIDLPRSQQVQDMVLYTVNGHIVRQFEGNKTSFNLVGLPRGLYFLKIRTLQGAFIEKLVLE